MVSTWDGLPNACTPAGTGFPPPQLKVAFRDRETNPFVAAQIYPRRSLPKTLFLSLLPYSFANRGRCCNRLR